MKANELMIGDWVLYNGQPKVVQMIDGYGDTELENEILCDGMYHKPIEVSPIPLTAEILDKNCADNVRERKYVGREWTWYNDDMDYIEVSTHAGGFDCRDGFFVSANDGEYYLFVIRYVHELQHALRLCGIEKEILCAN